MTGSSRRTFLAGSAMAPWVAAVALSDPAHANPTTDAEATMLEQAISHYAALGDKASGGPGDTAAGEWLEGELKQLGFQTARQNFDAPGFSAESVTLTCGDAHADLIPQAPVITTAVEGLNAPLITYPAWVAPPESVRGAIAMIVLPRGRWSSLLQGDIQKPLRAALNAGAAGIVIVTDSVTGAASALNAPAIGPASFDKPVAVIGGAAARPFLALSGQPARLNIAGKPVSRSAFNLTGRMDRGAKQWLVVSTPRSGWFGCTAERGPGVAVWLSLAAWAAKLAHPVNLAFLCTSGHEYEYLGSAHMMDGAVPAPAETAFWLHLGAGFAARDWHEAGPQLLLPLPSADPQRFLVATKQHVPAARAAFKGQPGLEAAYPAEAGAAGELSGILKAGYPAAAGMFGAHRYHHCREDDMRCVTLPPVVAAAAGARALIEAALAG